MIPRLNGVAARKESLNHDLRCYFQRNRHGIMSVHADWQAKAQTEAMYDRCQSAQRLTSESAVHCSDVDRFFINQDLCQQNERYSLCFLEIWRTMLTDSTYF